GRDDIRRFHRHRTLEPYAKTSLIRRFILPLLSIFATAMGPTSAVDRTCVPPQGCRSIRPSSPMATRRTRPVPVGGFTDIVRTRWGLAASSSSLIQREETG